MTWFAPVLVAFEDRFGSVAPDMWSSWPAAGGLGSAVAGPWSWDNAPAATGGSIQPAPQPAPRQPAGVRLTAPAGTLRRMADAAHALGRSESDVWVEAAREWLQRHEPEDPDGGHTLYSSHAPIAPSIARRARVWRAIDDVLDTLRDDQQMAQIEQIPA